MEVVWWKLLLFLLSHYYQNALVTIIDSEKSVPVAFVLFDLTSLDVNLRCWWDDLQGVAVQVGVGVDQVRAEPGVDVLRNKLSVTLANILCVCLLRSRFDKISLFCCFFTGCINCKVMLSFTNCEIWHGIERITLQDHFLCNADKFILLQTPMNKILESLIVLMTLNNLLLNFWSKNAQNV